MRRKSWSPSVIDGVIPAEVDGCTPVSAGSRSWVASVGDGCSAEGIG